MKKSSRPVPPKSPCWSLAPSGRRGSFRSRSLPLLLLLAWLAAGCGIVPGMGQGDSGPTPEPTATLDPAGYRSVPTRACPTADWTAMQSSAEQGDLLSWQPGSRDLAYLAPSDRSSWFVGELMLARAPTYAQREPLAPGVLVSGDLTWSPSGERLAFLAFRPDENVYTVMTVRADGGELTDLFPIDLARTDVRTSQKAIIGWEGEGTLQVMASCGEQCRNAYDISLDDPAGPQLTPTPIGDYKELTANLVMNRRELEYEEDAFPRNFLRLPHWSPDDRWVAYLDKRLLLWVLSPEEKITFLVDIGLRDVAETRWSPDSGALAIRAEDRIFVFEIGCQP